MTANGNHVIRFLGTGANDWLAPHECHDICRERCAKVEKWGGRNVRRPSSLFIEPDTLIDFTGPTAEALDTFGIDREAIRNLLITHGHNDHFQPLEILRFAAGLPHPLTVFCTEIVRDALEFAATHQWDADQQRFVVVRGGHPGLRNIQVKTAPPGTSLDMPGFRVTAVLANHMMDNPYLILEQQALNFVVEMGAGTAFYGLDSSYMLPEAFEIASRFRFDVLILDATFGHLEIDPHRSGHHNFAMMENTIAQFREAGLLKENAVIAASHLSRCYVDPHDEIADGLAERGVALAYDGMTLTV